MPYSLLSLLLAAFCVGTTEFAVAGLLPEVSSDLAIPIPTCAALISVYAMGVAVGGPAVTMATIDLPRKKLMLYLMAVFVLGHVVCVTAPNFTILLIGRLVVSLCHGSFYGVAAVVAASLVAPERRGSAVAILFAGISIATVLGVPIGTAIGEKFGYRTTFAGIGALGAVAFVAIWICIPRDYAPREVRSSWNAQFKALVNEQVLIAYLIFAIMQAGFWTFFSYVAPFLNNSSAIEHTAAEVLFALGVGSAVGSILGGRLADASQKLTLLVSFPLQALIYCVIVWSLEFTWTTTTAFGLLGAAVFMPSSAIVNRILSNASAAPDLASALVSTAANIGICIGPVIGSVALSSGHSYHDLPFYGASIACLAAWITIFCLARELRDQKFGLSTSG